KEEDHALRPRPEVGRPRRQGIGAGRGSGAERALGEQRRERDRAEPVRARAEHLTSCQRSLCKSPAVHSILPRPKPYRTKINSFTLKSTWQRPLQLRSSSGFPEARRNASAALFSSGRGRRPKAVS